MTSDSTSFLSTSSSSSLPTIYTVDGSHMFITHIGTILTSNVSLFDVYLVPTLTLKLVSVGQLCALGLTVIFFLTGCLVQDP